MTVRPRLRMLMAIIAIVCLEWTGGVAVWNSWEQWDCDRRIAAYDAFCVGMATATVRTGDIVSVEVFETLPDHPITGERTVHSDGTIDLGCYGKVSVAGLTIVEAKERIVLHLRRHLDDRQLGLIEFSESDPPAILRRISPSDSSCVHVY